MMRCQSDIIVDDSIHYNIYLDFIYLFHDVCIVYVMDVLYFDI